MPDGGALTLGCRRVALAANSAAAPTLPAGAYIEIFVQDTGSGMPESVRRRVFEPFFTTKGPGKGTGLGLSMVFGFATMSGGTATVESAPDAGTTVRVFLTEAAAQTVPADERSAAQPGRRTTGRTVSASCWWMTTPMSAPRSTPCWRTWDTRSWSPTAPPRPWRCCGPTEASTCW